MINSLIFPVPPCSYSLSSHYGSLIHIPRRDTGTFTFGRWIPYFGGLGVPGTDFVILYSHPNAVDIGMMYGMYTLSSDTKASVLMYEYRGYGMCDGTPEEEEINFDIESAYLFVTETLRFPPSRVILMGRSIGTGPSTKLAASVLCKESPPAGLLLQAPFTSIKDCVKTVGFLVADRFRNIDIIHDVACPVVLQHGDLDDIVEYSHSQRLLEAATSKGKPDVTLHTAVGRAHNNLSDSEAATIICNRIQAALQRQPVAVDSNRSVAPTIAMDRRWLAVPNPFREWFPSTCLTLGQLEPND